MRRSSQFGISISLAATFFVCLGLAIVVLTRIDRIRQDTRAQEILYVPSPAVLKRMTLGYTGLAADIYWTRTVQYFGRKHSEHDVDYRLLPALLDITTALDPQLIMAYRFGGIFLAQRPPAGAGQPEKGVELLERGIKNNPDDWHLYFDLGFLQAIERHDYIAASQAFARGARLPKTHPSLRFLAAVTAQRGGDPQLAKMLWETTLETADSKETRDNAVRHLRALRVDSDVAALEDLAGVYRRGAGRSPASLLDLVAARLLPAVPVDPVGHPYRLSPEGRVQVQDISALPFITKGIPAGATPLSDTAALSLGK